MPALTTLSDAAAGIHVGALRDETTAPAAFRQHAHVLGSLLAREALREIPAATSKVTTPLTTTDAVAPARRVVTVPVLRAGLGLLSGVLDLVPTAAVGMIGLERDPETLQPREYYCKLPDLDGAWALLLEPMLATGGSAATAATRLAEAGAAQVIVLSVVTTDIAVARVLEAVPGARVVAGALDPELDDNGYIVPGLGDFGDRLFGTEH